MYLLSTFNYKVRGGADLMVYLCFCYNAHHLFFIFLLQYEVNNELMPAFEVCVCDCSDVAGFTCNV